jgi:hypothetical protein
MMLGDGFRSATLPFHRWVTTIECKLGSRKTRVAPLIKDIRLRAQPNWCDSGLAPVSVTRSECSTTLMQIGDVICHDDPNDYAGQSIRLRPNPDGCDPGPAPIPASRSGCSDGNPSLLQLPSLGDLDSPKGVAPQPQCMKALVPLSKLKGLVDEEDIQDVRETRCDTCANCPTC